MDRSQLDLFGGEPHVAQNGHRKNGRKQRVNGSAKEASDESIEALVQKVTSLEARLEGMECILADLRELITQRQTVKDSYTTAEVAKVLGKRPYTVREWCRLQRINATKAMSGRGCEEEWRVSHEELLRIQNEGLLPIPDRY